MELNTKEVVLKWREGAQKCVRQPFQCAQKKCYKKSVMYRTPKQTYIHVTYFAMISEQVFVVFSRF